MENQNFNAWQNKITNLPSSNLAFAVCFHWQVHVLFNSETYANQRHIDSSNWRVINSDKIYNMKLTEIIIQQIVTLSKYGHDALDICHP